MITTTALEAQNRARAERPLVLVLTRKKNPASDLTVRAVTSAAHAEQLDAVALDVDEPANAAFVDELRVQTVPEVLVFQRGVVLERCGVHDQADAHEVLALALRRTRR